jgi:hypothetical protein
MRNALLSASIAVLASLLPAASAQAKGHEHNSGTFSDTVTDAAGTVCTFELRSTTFSKSVWNNVLDSNGSVVRQILNESLVALYENLETGQRLTESDHYSAVFNLVDDTLTTLKFSGINSRLRDEDGRLVFTWAGHFVFDFSSGEFVTITKPLATFAQIICPLLGGAPAPGQ